MPKSVEVLRHAQASARYRSNGYLFRSIWNCIASVLLKLYYKLVVVKRRLNLLTSCKVFFFFFYSKLHVIVLIRVSVSIGTDKEYGIGIGIDKILTIYIPNCDCRLHFYFYSF